MLGSLLPTFFGSAVFVPRSNSLDETYTYIQLLLWKKADLELSQGYMTQFLL